MLLRDERVNPNSRDGRAFRIALDKKNIRMINELIKDPRVDYRPHTSTILSIAVEKGKYRFLKRFLKKNNWIRETSAGNPALNIAVRIGSVYLCEILLNEGGVDPSENGNEALKIAIKLRIWEVIILLMDHCLDITDRNLVEELVSEFEEDSQIMSIM
eukprot:TRINITY_DN3246_c0_g1_i2.p1 TRINITY_DN3246_c0_g1~~TRINITY_DN3246_c0_g1_i2.p1  ORF type:complete len:158 (-),score=35.49 TRINITY_DN3246_c0_g1_i2:44-517(-)